MAPLWLPCGFHEAFQVYALDDVNTMPLHQVQHLVSRKIKRGWMDHIPSSVLKYHNAILRLFQLDESEKFTIHLDRPCKQ